MTKPLDILFIEDSEADYLLITRALKQFGLLGRFRRVDDHDSMIEALNEESWDLVLSDYSVPGLYFTETLGYFKHHFPKLPLILVSGTIGEVKAAVMVKLGAADYISKDSLDDLPPAIEKALARAAKAG
jgi:DNA-binding NtrC family response regulator